MDFGVVTPREREVFDLLGDHLTHEQIARRLFVSVRTVESHVASLRRKLDTPDHRALVRLAVEHRRRPDVESAAPTPLTSFVGRAHELTELTAAVTTARLVSVVGPGGAGKTRLALAVAGALGSQFSDGVRWVDLVPVRDAAGLEDALAQACGAVVAGRREPADAVIAVLRERQTLLVLDNCEHLVNGAAVLVERVLASCPGAKVLLTSRQRLAVPFERVFPVAGLSADVDGDAVALFVERARSAGAAAPSPPERERISAVCVAIGGLPLAVELAAVRMPALGLDGVERGLLDQAGLLTAGPRASQRHRSMNDTLDWSLALLPDAAAIALRRLAVFAAAFDLDSAIAVAGFSRLPAGDVPAMLTQLVEQSLVTAETAGGHSRYRMLEPVRQYAVARMTPEDTAAFGRHFDWCLRSADAALAGSAEAVLLFVDDLHAALAWGTAQGSGQDSAERTADLARVFGQLLFRTGRLREAQARFEQAAQLGRNDRSAVADLRHAAAIAKCRVRGEDALRLEVAAAERARAGGDSVAAALALASAAELVTRFAGMFATSVALDPVPYLAQAGDLAPHDLRVAAALDVATCGFDGTGGVPSLERARRALEAAQRVDDLLLESSALDALSAAHLFRREVVLAYELALRRVDRLRFAADDPSAALEVKDALHVATFCALGAGQLDTARDMAQAQHELAFLRESRDVADDELMAPAALSGDLETAAELGERFLQDWTDAGRPRAAGRAITPAAVALAHGLLGDGRARDAWLDVVAEIRGVGRDQASRGTGFGEVFDALVLLHQDRPREAFEVLTSDGDRGLYGMVFHQWSAALTAEAAIRSARPDVRRWIAAAEQETVGNPVASDIVRRAVSGAPGHPGRSITH